MKIEELDGETSPKESLSIETSHRTLVLYSKTLFS